MNPSSDLDDFAAALKDSPPGDKPTDEQVRNGALEFCLNNLERMSEQQLATLYEHAVGEVTRRGLDEEIMGEVSDAANISVDEEMNEMIKLVRTMRANLARQAASGKIVSNREIRETLTACVTAMKQLVSHQKAVRTLERQRTLESVLIETLGELDPVVQSDFQDRLRERLEELSE